MLRKQILFFGFFLILEFILPGVIKASQVPSYKIKPRFIRDNGIQLNLTKQEDLNGVDSLIIDFVLKSSNVVFDLESCSSDPQNCLKEMANITRLSEYFKCDNMKSHNYHGAIRHIKDSSVFLIMCHGIMGYMRNNTEIYVIQPASQNNTNFDSDAIIFQYKDHDQVNGNVDSEENLVNWEYFLYLMAATIIFIFIIASFLLYTTCKECLHSCHKNRNINYNVKYRKIGYSGHRNDEVEIIGDTNTCDIRPLITPFTTRKLVPMRPAPVFPAITENSENSQAVRTMKLIQFTSEPVEGECKLVDHMRAVYYTMPRPETVKNSVKSSDNFQNISYVGTLRQNLNTVDTTKRPLRRIEGQCSLVNTIPLNTVSEETGKPRSWDADHGGNSVIYDSTEIYCEPEFRNDVATLMNDIHRDNAVIIVGEDDSIYSYLHEVRSRRRDE